MSVTCSPCLTQTVCVCHRQSVSVTDCLYMAQRVGVRHRQSVSVTDSLCLPQTVCVCNRQSVSVTECLCLSRRVFACQSVSLLNTLLNHSECGFFLFTHGFHQYLSMRFEFVREYILTIANFVDPCPPPLIQPKCNN